MKKRIFMLIILGLFLFLPSNVFAEDYTFEIGNGKQWNESNIDQLSALLSDLQNQDWNDNKIDNKYTLNFADGNYDYSGFYGVCEGYVEYNFGTGNYKLDYLGGEIMGSITIKGKGIDKTHIQVDGLISELNGCAEISDMTIYVEYPYFETSGYTNLFEYGFTDIKQGLFFKNLVINTKDDDILEIYYRAYDAMPYIDFDNVTINGSDTLEFRIESNVYTQSKEKFINIKNSDLSDFDIYFEGYGERYKLPKLYFENTKLNKMYAKNIDIDVDCTSTFKNGITRGKGIDGHEDVFNSNQYTIYEYYEEGGQNNGKITTSVCKNKTVNIKNKTSLKNIKEEFGYEIDDTWTFNPEGIVELRNGELVPLKVGKVTISKEINGEVQNLTIDVTDVQKQNNVVVNPKTRSTLIVVITLILGLLGSVFYVFKNKKTKMSKEA